LGNSEAQPAPESTNAPPLLYYTQAGDTLPVVAVRFGVQPNEIYSPEELSPTGLLQPNQLLIIPNRLANTTSATHLLPDSELVYSPSAANFDVVAYVNEAGGYLSTYREYFNSTGWITGGEIVAKIALENSINPRLLLALLEYQSGWVFGQPQNLAQQYYPLGYINLDAKKLHKQLAWAVNQLSIGYYGWREGLLTELNFSDGAIARLAPDLNAGTVALQYYFAQLYNASQWIQVLNPDEGFVALYQQMFGNPWVRAVQVEPLYPPDLEQPPLTLPFIPGQLWHYTGGPHGAWERDGARAALDFAPSSLEPGCAKSSLWVVASAPGLIVRTAPGVVVLDLDGDGYEQTGWVLLYLHVDAVGTVQVGNWVEKGTLLGHPSCKGGRSTGTHLHIARKYNGEWIPADGPLPMVLSGWTAHAGEKPYEGTLTKDGETIVACPCGSASTRIVRTDE
jgi:murein DD-endopeptidase MepM/ murein hydrolase activator NlpD